MHKVRFLPSAAADLDRLDLYHAEIFPAGRKNAQRRLSAAFALISEHPFAGRPSRAHPHLREWPVVGPPFLLVYHVNAATIDVVGVKDQRREGA